MIFVRHQTLAKYQRLKTVNLTTCSLTIAIVIALLAACGTVSAQNLADVADTISITVSNRSDQNITLTLLPVQRPQPPRLLRVGTSTTLQATPPAEVKTNATHAAEIEQKVLSNHHAVFELHPGLYRLGMIPPLPEFGGFLSITNSETWILSMEPTKQTVGEASPKWKLEVPSRPGLQLIRPVTPP